MKRGKKLLILAAVLIVVAGGAFAALEFIPDEEAEVTESEVIYSLDAATLTNLSWTCDGETVSFDYNGEDWTYADDADFPLDPTRLNTMLSTLEEVTASKTIEAADDLAQYGLEEPECTITVTADAETVISVGSETSLDGLRYVSIGDGSVYLVDSGIYSSFSYGLYDLVAEEAIGDAPFAVINADDYYGPQGFKLIYDYLSTHADGDRYAWAMVGFLLGNTVSANGSVSRGVCVTDESRNLVSVTERTCIEPYADGIHYSEDGGKSWADLPADCVVSMNLWGFTPAYVQEAKAGFAAFLQASLPVNPMKCEYYLPTVVTNALEAGKADVHVLTSADKWHGITYREDKPELVEALKKMSEDGLYPVDRLF